MALLLMDGFDHYAAAQAAEKFWTGNIFGMVPGRGFTDGQAMAVINLNPVFKEFTPASTVICGAAIKLSGSVDTSFFWTIEVAGGGAVVTIGVDSSHRLTIRDSVLNLIATGTTVIPVATWFYVEVKCVVGTSGHVTVQLNGATEIASTVGNFGSTNIGRIMFWNHTFGDGLTNVDDVYVEDTAGSAPTNDFLGDVRVVTLYPVADASYTDWTPKTGTDHYKMVNELLIDGDGSYNHDANPGDKDSYKLDTYLGSVYGAQLNIGARKGDASVRQIKPLIKQGGTDYLGDLATLSGDYVFYSWLLDNDPSGAAWLAATINADEFGQKLIA